VPIGRERHQGEEVRLASVEGGQRRRVSSPPAHRPSRRMAEALAASWTCTRSAVLVPATLAGASSGSKQIRNVGGGLGIRRADTQPAAKPANSGSIDRPHLDVEAIGGRLVVAEQSWTQPALPPRLGPAIPVAAVPAPTTPSPNSKNSWRRWGGPSQRSTTFTTRWPTRR
jgi:hypothetical protein